MKQYKTTVTEHRNQKIRKISQPCTYEEAKKLAFHYLDNQRKEDMAIAYQKMAEITQLYVLEHGCQWVDLNDYTVFFSDTFIQICVNGDVNVFTFDLIPMEVKND